MTTKKVTNVTALPVRKNILAIAANREAVITALKERGVEISSDLEMQLTSVLSAIELIKLPTIDISINVDGDIEFMLPCTGNKEIDDQVMDLLEQTNLRETAELLKIAGQSDTVVVKHFTLTDFNIDEVPGAVGSTDHKAKLNSSANATLSRTGDFMDQAVNTLEESAATLTHDAQTVASAAETVRNTVQEMIVNGEIKEDTTSLTIGISPNASKTERYGLGGTALVIGLSALIAGGATLYRAFSD